MTPILVVVSAIVETVFYRDKLRYESPRDSVEQYCDNELW